MKSNFESDLSKEKKLSKLLDGLYEKNLTNYRFKRISNYEEQMQGIDLVFEQKKSNSFYFIDEKAQLDYINKSLPTFAFELFYQKDGTQKQGWLFDENKKTQFYALVTSIFSDEKNRFTSCSITFVNREKLIQHLSSLGLTQERFQEIVYQHKGLHGKLGLEKLHPWQEGYLYFSTQNKAEQPINLVLKLDYLIAIGVAKRLV